ncbi:MAG: discoidin domain-containing protein, partial [Planctomycetota bacterium]
MCKKLILLTSFVLVLALAGTNVVFGDVVWEGRIAIDSDDAEEQEGGSMYNSSGDLEIPYEGIGQSGLQIIGIRFPNVTVPRGAAVTNAYVELTCDEVKGGTEHVSLIIEGELSPDAITFGPVGYDITNRPKTTAQVVWDVAKWTNSGDVDQTSNIAPVIQEIISQPGWVSGNALVLIISDNPANPSVGVRCAEAGPGSDSAMLHIEWSRKYAKDPNPADGQTDVPRDLVLSWTPGEDTAPVNGHKVYFSGNFDDVKNGIGGITLSDARYVPTQDIGLATTYYWRVDEVTQDNTVYEGRVWSFTTELFVYPIENVTATASSQAPNQGPENIANGSGLDDSGLLHGKKGDDNMWLSDMAGPQPTWIEFEFDNVCKLLEMLVWNYNDSLEPMIGFGFKDVSIEYSANGTDYTTLGTTAEFARAPGMPDYAHNTTIDFGGMPVRYVRLTANSNWGGMLPQYGLSEVRFTQIPVSARAPNPDSGATGVPLDVVLDWAAGREGVSHDVHFGDDGQAVIDSTTPVATVTESNHGPLDLDLGKTYYWRVDEINEAATPTTWPGGLWSFTTTDHLVVDDFESYNDLDPAHPKSNRIFNVWIDG